MDKKKIFKIVSVVCVGAAVATGYFGGISESGIMGLVAVGFGVVAALIAVFK